MPENGIEKLRAGLSLGLARSPPPSRPGLDKGPDEPRPDGSLVIGAVSLANAPLIVGSIPRLPGRQRAQAERCPEARLNGLDDAAGPIVLEQGDGKTAHGEDLVRAEGGIGRPGLMIRIDHIVEIPAGLVPEAGAEGLGAACEEPLPRLRELAPDPEGVEPEGLDLDRLADPRRDDPVAHLGIQPGELHARLSSGQETVIVETDAVTRPLAVAGQNRL